MPPDVAFELLRVRHRRGRTSLLVALVALALSGAPPPSARAATCIFDAGCADGDLCNGVERCVAGECTTAPPLVCDDGDPCTRDLCDPAIGCVHPEETCPEDCAGLVDGTRCADRTVCTRGDACAGGACAPGASVECSDGDACTREVCDPQLGCVYTEEAVEFPCVPDCNGGVADYSPCPGDDNVCTLDACLPSVDLIGNPHMCIIGLLGLDRQCQDLDLCNGQEFCSPVLGCEPGAPLVCDDGAVCNGVESCDPALGCRPGTPEPDGTTCDDGRECTVDDACAGGTCSGMSLPASACDDANGATLDECVEGFGCLHCTTADLGRAAFRRGSADGRLKLRGVLPATAAAALAVSAAPVSVVIHDGTTRIFSAELPPGALTANATGGRFRYADPHNLVGPVRSVVIHARRGVYHWHVVARGTALAPLVPATVAVRLLIGNACFRADAPCAPAGASVICR